MTYIHQNDQYDSRNILMLSNSLYIQIYINIRYEQALDCSIPDTTFSAEYSYLSPTGYRKKNSKKKID